METMARDRIPRVETRQGNLFNYWADPAPTYRNPPVTIRKLHKMTMIMVWTHAWQYLPVPRAEAAAGTGIISYPCTKIMVGRAIVLPWDRFDPQLA